MRLHSGLRCDLEWSTRCLHQVKNYCVTRPIHQEQEVDFTCADYCELYGSCDEAPHTPAQIVSLCPPRQEKGGEGEMERERGRTRKRERGREGERGTRERAAAVYELFQEVIREAHIPLNDVVASFYERCVEADRAIDEELAAALLDRRAGSNIREATALNTLLQDHKKETLVAVNNARSSRVPIS